MGCNGELEWLRETDREVSDACHSPCTWLFLGCCPYGQYHGNWEMKKSSEREQAARRVCNLLNFLFLFYDIENRYVI